jgi:hypothetical protein
MLFRLADGVLTADLEPLSSTVISLTSFSKVSDRVLCSQGSPELHSQSNSRFAGAIVR